MKTTQTPASDQPIEVKPYLILDEETGDYINPIKYLEAHPKQYRFDAKAGDFNIDGKSSVGSKLVFQPIAWRIFTDNILNMGTKNWAEIFFIDQKNCVSAVLFHGYSVDNLFRLIEPLFYDDLTLADVVITATAEKKENTNIQPKGIYYIAEFTYTTAETERTKALKAFAADNKIYRKETLTDIANIKTSYNYFNPFANNPSEDLLIENGIHLLN
jgi:hypothetical protein